jgi:nitrate reductase gamma subunit
MVIDGLSGSERVMKVLGTVYDIITASGDIFGLLVAISIIIFLSRRLFFHIRRFEGIEMKHSTHVDANIALTMILLLMISLLGMNSAYVGNKTLTGEPIRRVPGKQPDFFPVNGYFPSGLKTMYEIAGGRISC